MGTSLPNLTSTKEHEACSRSCNRALKGDGFLQWGNEGRLLREEGSAPDLEGWGGRMWIRVKEAIKRDGIR